MTDGPLVTMSIPTYKRPEDYLERTLQSALDQTNPNIEIVIADNCSIVHTNKLIE